MTLPQHCAMVLAAGLLVAPSWQATMVLGLIVSFFEIIAGFMLRRAVNTAEATLADLASPAR
jgi:hypothetical protein